MDSRSLGPLLSSAVRTHRPHVRSGLDSWRLVFDGRYKLVRGAPGDREGKVATRLFELADDPWEPRDLAAERPAEVERLTPLLAPGT
jgi:hypothetical protein